MRPHTGRITPVGCAGGTDERPGVGVALTGLCSGIALLTLALGCTAHADCRTQDGGRLVAGCAPGGCAHAATHADARMGGTGVRSGCSDLMWSSGAAARWTSWGPRVAPSTALTPAVAQLAGGATPGAVAPRSDAHCSCSRFVLGLAICVPHAACRMVGAMGFFGGLLGRSVEMLLEGRPRLRVELWR